MGGSRAPSRARAAAAWRSAQISRTQRSASRLVILRFRTYPWYLRGRCQRCWCEMNKMFMCED
jgi:hypothetical protein